MCYCFVNKYNLQVSDLSQSALAHKALVCYKDEKDAKRCLYILLKHGMNPNIYVEVILIFSIPLCVSICASMCL